MPALRCPASVSRSAIAAGRRAPLAGFALAVAVAVVACRPEAGETVPAGRLDRASGGRPAPAAAEPLAPEPPPEGRLGDTLVPRTYQLDLDLDPEADGFHGRVLIDVTISRATSSIWLHAASSLAIGDAAVEAAGRRYPLRPLAGGEARGLRGFTVEAALAPGPARLELLFHGSYGRNDGVFVQEDRSRAYLYTDFEPQDARRAFPCFDEPRFKTPFTLSLLVADDLAAFANMPPAREVAVAGRRKKITFATTPPLPTYLLAFAVGPFEAVEIPDAPVPMRILVPDGRAPSARSARELAVPLLRALQSYVGRPVPFPKVDFVAVPFFNGAMENPGLITVARDILLHFLEPTIAERRFLSMVLAHELAHLWFGDLVTPEDWSELWLNEGFATWMADKATAAVRPEAQLREIEIDDKQDALAEDDIATVRAMRAPIGPGDDPRERFDVLAYKKGGALLHMIEAWIGEAATQTAVRDYLERHAGGSATTADLIAALVRASGRDVAAPLSSFLDRAGAPLVEATPRCDGGRLRVTLAQRRALPEPAAARLAGEAAAATWAIPVCLRWGGSGAPTTACILLDRASQIFEHTVASCPRWLHPNADGAGYYRYALPAADLEALARAAGLTVRERADLVRDLEALLLAGRLTLAEALAAVTALSHTDDRAVLAASIGFHRRVGELVLSDDEGLRRRFAAHVRALFGKKARALGLAPVAGESEAATLLRPALARLVGELGHEPAIVAEAQRRARRWLRRGGRAAGADPTMLGVTLEIAAAHGDAALYGAIAARREALEPSDVGASALLGSALAAFREPTLVARTLAALGAVSTRIGDEGAYATLASLMSRRAQRALTIAHIEREQPNLGYWPASLLQSTELCDLHQYEVLSGYLDKVGQPARQLAGVLRRRRAATEACAALRARVATEGPAALGAVR